MSSRLPLKGLGHIRATRLLHASSPARAACVDAFGAPCADVPSIPQIFDIFDAPTRLGGGLSRALQSSRWQAPPKSVRPARTGRPAPAPLPTPVLFDGPARPHSIHTAPVQRVQKKCPSPECPYSPKAVPKVLVKQPEVELFDGPARRTLFLSHVKSVGFETKTQLMSYPVVLVTLFGGSLAWFIYQLPSPSTPVNRRQQLESI